MLSSRALKVSSRVSSATRGLALATAQFSTEASPSGTNSGSSKSWAHSDSTSKSLKIRSKKYRKTVLDGVSQYGPPSLKSSKFRRQYTSPNGLDKAFDTIYEYLVKKSSKEYDLVKEIDAKLAKDSENKSLRALKYKSLVRAEIYNPEVRFNFEFYDKINNDVNVIDYDQPVYRELLRKHWNSYSKMLTMQRLEQLHVIPDTLPTLEPKVEVHLKFLNHTTENNWIEPGKTLSSNVTTYAPSFKIQEFENIDIENQLYSILLVNPDVPDILNNTYKTHLQWGLTNIKIGFNDNFIGAQRLLQDSSINEVIEYLPPVPEKNLQKQRFCFWVFRQPTPINDKLTERAFDIREYVKAHKLEPVGGHVWRSEWDSNVSNVRELYGLPKGIVFHKVRQ